MRKPTTFLTTMVVLTAAVNLAGCMTLSADGPFHDDGGDLVSNDGSVRYVGWCRLHSRNANCAAAPVVVASESSSADRETISD